MVGTELVEAVLVESPVVLEVAVALWVEEEVAVELAGEVAVAVEAKVEVAGGNALRIPLNILSDMEHPTPEDSLIIASRYSRRELSSRSPMEG